MENNVERLIVCWGAFDEASLASKLIVPELMFAYHYFSNKHLCLKQKLESICHHAS